MKKYIFKVFIPALTLILLLSACQDSANHAKTETTARRDIAIVYTNDVHCALDENIGYAGLAAYKKELEADGCEVLLVDSGDAIQGAPMGALSKGENIIDIMNQLGYAVAIPGNHEFTEDYTALIEYLMDGYTANSKLYTEPYGEGRIIADKTAN
ncbi:MAG: metallophosphoesterase [Clostridium sp.]